MSRPIIIAIDGYSSCGKSTLPRQLASTLDYRFIDTAPMSRAVTYYMLKTFVKTDDPRELEAAMMNIQINFIYNSDRRNSDTYLNGMNVEEEIRSMEVADNVSNIAALPIVRRFLVKQQQEMGRHKGLVMD